MRSPRFPSQEWMPNPRLMVIDEESATAETIQQQLADAWRQCAIIACTPAKTLDRIVQECPDILLLGPAMPESRAIEMLQTICSDERLCTLPVILLTSPASISTRARALQIGITDFLHTPLDSTELLPRLRNALAIKALSYHDKSRAGDGMARQEKTGLREDDPRNDEGQDTLPQATTAREFGPRQWSWPVLRQTSFQELKSAAKVMIVDDQPTVVKLARKYLADDGYQHFITTTDSTEALPLIERDGPDVLLLDIMMPQVSGLDILEAVRSQERVADLPVIILTAATDAATKHRALDLGATEFLAKPIDPIDVLPRVRNALVLKAHRNQVETYARQLDRRVAHHLAQAKTHVEALGKANAALRRCCSEVQAADRAKSEFLASMSHEIRTPLTAMIGFAELMALESASGTSSQQDVANLDAIVRNGRHLLEVINDVLDLSKIEAGQFEPEIIPCSPIQILNEVLESMLLRAEAKGLRLQGECLTAIPDSIRTDPTCLRQILLNLISNGIKFTERGSVHVLASLLSTENGQPQLQIEVVDSGIGIASEQLERLFRPFTQAEASVRRRFGGTGLGLAICRKLAEKLGGMVSVESRPAEGSAFRLVLPTGPLQGIAMLQSPLDGRQPIMGWRTVSPSPTPGCECHGRVLLAEDSVDNQRLFCCMLQRAGADVVIAENGQVAFETAVAAQRSGRPFDVILMDMQMPVLDGYEATRKLRESGYLFPIVALTAHAMSGEQEKCVAAGCDDYLAKPISRETLLGAVARHAGRTANTA